MWIVPKIRTIQFCKIVFESARRSSERWVSTKTVSLSHGLEEVGLSEQKQYIESALVSPTIDWDSFKSNLLTKRGHINIKNIDAVILRYMITRKKLESAVSFAAQIRTVNNSELNIGTINSLLDLYAELGKQNKLCNEDKEFIIEMHKYLHDKYKTLDWKTCECLLNAFCAIGDIEKAYEVFEEIFVTFTPTHSAFCILTVTLFKMDREKDALKIINRGLENKRQPLNEVYFEWIGYICRNYKTNKTKLENLEQILELISKLNVRMSEALANKFINVFSVLNWTGNFTKIRKSDGQCLNCKEKLKYLYLSSDEFEMLQKIVKKKLIVGSDLFFKSTPTELQRFQAFINETAPYDVVLDALNIAYAAGSPTVFERVKLLSHVVNYFVRSDKTVLLLGRQHMLTWKSKFMKDILSKCHSFFTENLSQDDPYFITAAILSGPHTDIVSKDILRNHKFVLGDEKLRSLFERWRWQHQWMVFQNVHSGTSIQAPWSFTPTAQRSHGWHLPYEKIDAYTKGQVRDGTPDLATWLCLQPNVR